MAESGNYPQLPRNVWRGVWDILRKTPKRKLDEKALSAELAVQPTAAKAYSRELMKLGLLDEDSTPTELANRWRQDGQNTEILDEILEKAYPQDLRDLAPRDGADREKIIRWFMNEGLGEGSAKNKAATYLMVASGVTDEASPVLSTKRASVSVKTKSKARLNTNIKDVPDLEERKGNNDTGTARRQSKPGLNVNVQIHISADASAEQIEAIFSSMKRYFDESD
jgi:hypothetical protein